jgi:hypothetical protein
MDLPRPEEPPVMRTHFWETEKREEVSSSDMLGCLDDRWRFAYNKAGAQREQEGRNDCLWI